MTNRFFSASRAKIIRYAVIGVVVIIALFTGFKFLGHMKAQAVTETEVIAAVRANFPDFCTDGQIIAKPFLHDRPVLPTDFDVQWGIKCDSWLKTPMGFYGEATIIDVDQCMTIRPIIDTLGEYYFQFEALNKKHQLDVCP